MTTKQQDKRQGDKDKYVRQERNAEIGRHVIRALGQPADLHKVQVRHLWDEHYRVNVFVGANGALATVAHSFFLVADGDGNIIATTPALAKHY